MKLVLHILVGGSSGFIFTMLFFLNESSSIRAISMWGQALVFISSMAGALLLGVFYYQMYFTNIDKK